MQYKLTIPGRLPYIIRRLAPLECGRLQGFPDGWAEIAPMNADDPEEIRFWMGVYATDCKIKGKRVNTEIIKHPVKLARWMWRTQLHSNMGQEEGTRRWWYMNA